MTQISQKFQMDDFIQETPSGSINGTNVTFTIANPTSDYGSVLLFRDGLQMIQGTDFTILNQTITMTTAPASGMSLSVQYMKA